MNVKQVILYCDHWQNGGVESYLMNQLRHWELSQMECTLLSAEKTTDIYDAELKELGVQQHVAAKRKCFANPSYSANLFAGLNGIFMNIHAMWCT